MYGSSLPPSDHLMILHGSAATPRPQGIRALGHPSLCISRLQPNEQLHVSYDESDAVPKFNNELRLPPLTIVWPPNSNLANLMIHGVYIKKSKIVT